jgi:uncharacterized protein
MDYLAIAIAALLASGLTMYSGFGLGTILMPVFALFLPVDMAVAATAIVHGANSLFKVLVVGQYSSRRIILTFGIPAVLAAFVGAATLGYVSHLGEWFEYSIGGLRATITPLKVIMGVLMLAFAGFELLPRLRTLTIDQRYLSFGGILSGFFGGLSGHQGALRSAFLAKVGIPATAFVGTNAVIGLMVDLARLTTYAALIVYGDALNPLSPGQWPLIVTGIAAAFAGVLLGRTVLHKVTIQSVQMLTGVMLIIIALGLGSGLI